jgi:hypothetical protein
MKYFRTFTMATVAVALSAMIAAADDGDVMVLPVDEAPAVGEGKPRKQRGERAAKGEKRAREKKPAAPLEDITLTGTIEKVEKTRKSKAKEGQEAKETVVVSYVLSDAEGNKSPLPAARPPKKRRKKDGEGEAAVPAPAAVNPADFVGQEVTVVGQGRQMDRGGKKVVRLMKLVSITPVGSE